MAGKVRFRNFFYYFLNSHCLKNLVFCKIIYFFNLSLVADCALACEGNIRGRARNVCLSARSDHCHVVNVDVSIPSPFCRLEESKYQGIFFLLNVTLSRTDQFDRTSSK